MLSKLMKSGGMYVEISRKGSLLTFLSIRRLEEELSLLRYECSSFRQGTDVFSWLDSAKRLMCYIEYEGDISDTL